MNRGIKYMTKIKKEKKKSIKRIKVLKKHRLYIKPVLFNALNQ